MVYLDNAATSYPKPPGVIRAAVNAAACLGGNPGRSGHNMSLKAAEAVYGVREKAADFFGASPENVIFTQNCTHSINLALKGFLMPFLTAGEKVHVIHTDMEHNSVARPVYELSKYGVSYSIAEVSADGEETAENIRRLITPDTKAVICTLGSNVTGQLTPFRLIGKICREYGICFIGDGAQVCGSERVNLKEDGINILCAPGHKGLFGLCGTGLLITDGAFPLYHIIEGGTGSTSADLEQTPFLPDGLESGTVNTPGIASLGAGMDFINRVGIDNIRRCEECLCGLFISRLRDNPYVKIYRRPGAEYLPIVLFNIDGFAPEETAAYLNGRGFALRGGLHCSPLAHTAIGTFPLGGVRFSPSCFNTPREIMSLAGAVERMACFGCRR
ncbi:MAG: aminotransferase class V-fold PLP-dependent enzyme [Ruminococcus sp.]|nr:aminotransferase class V-fold PLP-dependent enzyme [Ruminococcus sp.]